MSFLWGLVSKIEKQVLSVHSVFSNVKDVLLLVEFWERFVMKRTYMLDVPTYEREDLEKKVIETIRACNIVERLETKEHVEYPDNMTELMLVVRMYWISNERQVALVKKLLNSGVDVNAKNAHGLTAMDYCHSDDIVQLLLDHGSQLSIRNSTDIEALAMRTMKLVPLVPGTMSLRKRNSNHLLQQEDMIVLLEQLSEAVDVYLGDFRVMYMSGYEDAVEALWNLELVRYKMKKYFSEAHEDTELERERLDFYRHLCSKIEIPRMNLLCVYEHCEKHRLNMGDNGGNGMMTFCRSKLHESKLLNIVLSYI